MAKLFETTNHLAEGKSKHTGLIHAFSFGKVINLQLAQGEKVPPHSSVEELLIVVRSGKIIFTVEGEAFTLTNETILNVPAGAVHDLSAEENSDVLVMKMQGK